MSDTAKRSGLFAWCQLFRVPNLLTVPGDPLVGFLAARAACEAAGPSAGTDSVAPVHGQWLPAVLVMAAAVVLYMRGLVTNDICDFPEDRRDRPSRPLPSGRIALPRAFITAAGLGVAGIVAAGLTGVRSMAIAAGLVLLVWAYNRHLKRIRLIGPLAMGACRGLSVLMGAAAGGAVLAGAELAGVWALYIAAVTHLAAGEMDRKIPPLLERLLPGMVLAVWAIVFATGPLILGGPVEANYRVAVLLLVLAVLIAVGIGRSVDRPEKMPPAIGKWIRLLLIMQCAGMILSLGEQWPLGLLPLALLPAATFLSRRFYAS